MKELTIKIKCKVGKFEKIIEAPYQEPETWEEAIQMDKSETKAFATYLIKRKTNEMDRIRKKEIAKMQETLIAKMAELGIEL